MYKRVITAILVGTMLLGLSGCGQTVEDTSNDNEASRFVLVENGTYWDVYYDKYTLVMYVCSNGVYNSGYNSGNFEPLLNPDGTPLLYEEE